MHVIIRARGKSYVEYGSGKRISFLENELALLKQKVDKIEKPKEAWWKEGMGTFADDPAHEEAMRLGREYRLAQREDYDKDNESNDNS